MAVASAGESRRVRMSMMLVMVVSKV